MTLLKRQTEIENAMRNPGGIRITQEQELHHIRRQLQQFPEAAHALRKPLTTLSSIDVETWATRDKVA